MIARLVDHLSTGLANVIVAPLFWGVREVDAGLADFGGEE